MLLRGFRPQERFKLGGHRSSLGGKGGGLRFCLRNFSLCNISLCNFGLLFNSLHCEVRNLWLTVFGFRLFPSRGGGSSRGIGCYGAFCGGAAGRVGSGVGNCFFCGPVGAFKPRRSHEFIGQRCLCKGRGRCIPGRGLCRQHIWQNVCQGFCPRCWLRFGRGLRQIFSHRFGQKCRLNFGQGICQRIQRSGGRGCRYICKGFCEQLWQRVVGIRWRRAGGRYGQFCGRFCHGRKQLVGSAAAVFFGQKICEFDGGLVIGLLRCIGHERQQHALLIVGIHGHMWHDRLCLRIQ